MILGNILLGILSCFQDTLINDVPASLDLESTVLALSLDELKAVCRQPEKLQRLTWSSLSRRHLGPGSDAAASRGQALSAKSLVASQDSERSWPDTSLFLNT